jgi:hemoglobin
MSVSIGEHRLYERIGEAGFTDLVARFYARVRGDDILGPMYPEADFDGAERRLRLFLIQRFGGPHTYDAERGHPRLRARHNPFPIDRPAAERWLLLMNQAMQEAIDARTIDRPAADILWPFFVQTASFMINRDAPAGESPPAG